MGRDSTEEDLRGRCKIEKGRAAAQRRRFYSAEIERREGIQRATITSSCSSNDSRRAFPNRRRKSVRQTKGDFLLVKKRRV